MPLTAGTTLLQYRLLAPIGSGGMGVVWRAQDTTLGREVALKFLPDVLAADPERLARLEREARLLASLNHPRIASIYGFHQAEGARFLAMELVEGEDLSQRLERGPFPMSDALPIAFQIAEALEHAHEKGVIHRDLKPANVKLTGDGSVKVLDFGLAKAIEGDPANPHSGSALSHSPTITGGMTAAHVLLGTAAYMSPEQARGQVADRRADIWAFGAVLMEMLTGRRLFEGETITDTLAAVLRHDPDFSTLPADTPPRVRTLIRRCLMRDAKVRLRDIGEARIALDETLRGAGEEARTPAAAAPAEGLAWLPALFAILAVSAAAFALARLTAPRPLETVRKFLIAADTSGSTPQWPVISPDGRSIATIVHGRIVIRELDHFESRTINAEPATLALFWSPDSRSLGYVAGSRVVKVSVADGSSQVLSDTRAEFTGGSGGTWTERGTVLVSRGDSLGILEISDRGGDPRTLVPLDPRLESDFHDPSALPGGRGVLFVPHGLTHGTNQIALWANGQRRVLLDLADQRLSSPRYSPTGHILFRRVPNTPGIWAFPFSLAKLERTGEPFLVAAGGAAPSVAGDGTLCYLPGESISSTALLLIDRKGTTRAIGAPGSGSTFVGADFARNRVARAEIESGNQDVWVYDLTRGTRTRLTFDPGADDISAWSADGREVLTYGHSLNCNTAECWKMMTCAADGTGRVDTIATGVAGAYTPDGHEIVFIALSSGFTRWELMRVPRDRSAPPTPLLVGKPYIAGGRVSPDGRFLAYQSNESGRFEVYLTRYPGCEGRWQVSTQGGQWPQWSPRGDRLYFCRGGEVFEVDATLGESARLGTPRVAFRRPDLGPQNFGLEVTYVVSPDGANLLTVGGGATSRSPGVAIVENWAAEFAGRK